MSVKKAVIGAGMLLALIAGVFFPAWTGAEDAKKKGKGEPTRSQPAQKNREAGTGEKKESTKTVVAKVNGVDITMESVIAMTNRMAGNRALGESASEGMEEIRQKALNQLIFQELAFQEAKARGLKVNEKELEGAMADVKVKRGGEEGYRKFLEGTGLSEKELRVEVERNLLLRKIFAQEVREKVKISEDELKRIYESEKAKYHKPEKVLVIDVVLFLSIEDKASEEKGETILRKIREDKERNPWNLSLDGTFIVREREIEKNKDRDLYEAARKLDVGELSGIIKTPDSLHIIKLKEYSPEEQIPFDKVKGNIERKLGAEAQQKRMHEWEAELKKGAKIEIMEANQ